MIISNHYFMSICYKKILIGKEFYSINNKLLKVNIKILIYILKYLRYFKLISIIHKYIDIYLYSHKYL